MRTQFLGDVIIRVPFALVDFSIPGLTREQAEQVVEKAVHECLLFVINGVSFGPGAPQAMIEVMLDEDALPTLNCPCGGCVGVQTCSED